MIRMAWLVEILYLTDEILKYKILYIAEWMLVMWLEIINKAWKDWV
jgi:hypothetical protein